MNYNALIDKFNIKESAIDWKIGYILIDFRKCCKQRLTLFLRSSDPISTSSTIHEQAVNALKHIQQHKGNTN